MKTLVVAHPDDEILWFNPSVFDLIIIVFCDRYDKKFMGSSRRKAISELPYSSKILMLNINEPGTWKDNSKTNEYKAAQAGTLKQLGDIRNNLHITSVFTHNNKGEYGHLDHILVHDCVIKTFFKDCQIWTTNVFIGIEGETRSHHKEHIEKYNILQFKAARDIYIKNSAWTWDLNYLPNEIQTYSLANEEAYL